MSGEASNLPDTRNAWEQMPLMAEWRRVRGGDECPQVRLYANAIHWHALSRDRKATRSPSMLAEAMHYVCKGGFDGFLAELRALELLHAGQGQLVLRDGLWRSSSMSGYSYGLNEKMRHRIHNLRQYLPGADPPTPDRTCALGRKCGFCNWVSEDGWRKVL